MASPDISPTPNSEELDEDTRTFEEKYYLIESTQLGEGCSSVVKECLLRSSKSVDPPRLVNR
jgi:hypothetical protein